MIGDEQIPELLGNLPQEIREQARRTPRNLIFKFANHQTLPSKTALLLPLSGSWIRIRVVKGNTPFLLSSSFLKHIRAVKNTDQGTYMVQDPPKIFENVSIGQKFVFA